MTTTTFSLVWLDQLRHVLTEGRLVSPRGKNTLEVLNMVTKVNMRQPVLQVPERKLSYRFMAAEAAWILAGDDRVSTIQPYNPNISQFSDNGETFFGAYGPKIMDQAPYVVEKLRDDPDSRQAGLTIWREKPPATKDVPCTVSMFFNIRDGKLNAHVFMRSSDLWLGLPYDVFTFSMVAHMVCCRLNIGHLEATGPLPVEPGDLYVTAASGHLYEHHWQEAEQALKTDIGPLAASDDKTPTHLFLDEATLRLTLGEVRSSKPGDPCRWWEWF